MRRSTFWFVSSAGAGLGARSIPGPLLLLVLLGSACEGCPGGGTSLGQATAAATVTPENVDLGAGYVGEVREATVTVRSTGTADVVDIRASITGATEFAVTPTTLARLGPGEAAPFTVSLVALGAGSFAGTLVLDTTTPAASHRIPLQATAQNVPNCEDNNLCTLNLFNVATGMCESSNTSSPCMDGNACTQNDRCTDGTCLGLAANCADTNPCTLDLCEPTVGCVHPVDTSRCVDTNPCTLDLCDAVTGGCSHPNAPDGTSCAPLNGCSTMFLCASGQCMPFQVPDGFPCEDGNLCTTGDRCQAGVCTASRPQLEPTVEASLFRYGGPEADFVRVGPDRLVVADGPFLTVVQQGSGGVLTVLSQLLVPGKGGRTWMVTTQAGGLAALMEEAQAPWGGRLVLYNVQPDGTLVALSPGETLGVPSISGRPGMQLLEHGGVLFACASDLRMFEVATGAALGVVEDGNGMSLRCQGILRAGDNRLEVILPQSGSGEDTVLLDVSSPVAPVVLGAPVFTPQQYTQSSGDGWVVRTQGNQINVMEEATGAVLGQLPFTSGTTWCVASGTVWGAATTAPPPGTPPVTVLDGYRLARGQFALASRVTLSQSAVPSWAECSPGLVTARMGGRAEFLDVTDPLAPQRLTGVQMGTMRVVAPSTSGVRTAGPQGVYPALSAGNTWTWEQPFLAPERGDIFRVAGTAGPHLVPGVDFLGNAYPVGVWDITDVSNPQYAQVPATLQRMTNSSSALYWLTSELGLHRIGLDFGWPPGMDALTPQGEPLVLPAEGHRTRHASDIRVSINGTRLSWLTNGPEGLDSVALVDISVVPPVILGELTFPSLGYGSGMPAAESMVVLRGRTLTRYALNIATAALEPGPDLMVGNPLDINDWPTHILSYDGINALLSYVDRVEFFQVAGPSPQLLGSIPTPQQVLDVTYVDNRLVAVSANALLVVSPPCPPPGFP